MRLVDVATYRVVTGDTATASAAVEDAIDDATAALEEDLRRSLPYGEYVETLPVLEGRVYPGMTPLTSSTAGTIDGATIRGLSPDWDETWWDVHCASQVTVTYVGGFTPDSLPVSLRDDIAWGAHARTHLDRTRVPVGAVSVTNDGASVTFGSGFTGGQPWSSQSLRWRRR